MFEKNMNIGYLLDFYGDILPDRKRQVMKMYYDEDLSLAEIAEIINITRQGVRDIIKKSTEELLFYEEKLGLAKKLQNIQLHAANLTSLTQLVALPREVLSEVETLVRLTIE